MQHTTTQHNTTQHNTTQHNTTQHNTTQHNTTQQRHAGRSSCQQLLSDISFQKSKVPVNDFQVT
jgi:hypothetical protein